MLLLTGARVAGAGADATDVAIDDGRIVAVGPDAAAGNPGAERVELGGRYLLPGLWDHHAHMGQWALARRRVDVSGAESAAAAVARIREHLATSPGPEPGTVLVGYGFRDSLWADRLTAEALRVGEVPVSLIAGDVHTVWSNAAALRILGWPSSAAVVREQEAFDAIIRLSDVPEALLDRWVQEAAVAAAARGTVGVVDFEMQDAGAAWQRRVGAGSRQLRIEASVYPEDLGAAVARGQRSGELLDGGAGLLAGGPFKIFADGSLGSRTAWCREAYAGLAGPGSHGVATYDLDGLAALLRVAVGNGLEPTVHAIGDLAVTEALDAFATAGCGGSIQHAQLVDPADVPRFAALEVGASVQPEHAMDDRDAADRLWAGRTDQAFPLRDLLDAGARLTFGSDAPVAPLDPWVSMAAAVTRSRDGRDPWHPEQRVTPREALAASTRSRVAVGQPADLVIVEADPLEPSGAALRQMTVAGTLLAGRWTHRGTVG